nr:PREDICTED: uncharacterized protein LOC103281513 isoform X1 [Anolis carolinensis]|eukprot:XP_008121435.1 PREDICTED: uncharacterized protein LOC103281513 isoform X1 [Anolis carolinensis]
MAAEKAPFPGWASDEEDEAFELFLTRIKNPRAPRSGSKTPSSARRVKEPKEDFLSYLADKYGSAQRGPRPLSAAGTPGMPWKKRAPRSVSLPPPLTFSDSDDDQVFVDFTPRNPRQPQRSGLQQGGWRKGPSASSLEDRVPHRQSPDSSSNEEEEEDKGGSGRGNASGAPGAAAHSWRTAMSARSGSGSSDEEIGSLATRIKQRMLLSSEKSGLRTPGTSGERPSPAHPCPSVKREQPRPLGPCPSTPPAGPPQGRVLANVTQRHRTPPARGGSCRVQGCFLQELSDPETQHCKRFRSLKEELARSLYAFYNTSVFEQKLPESMEILWNKKMRKTAGCCVTGRRKGPPEQRYARIMLSEKVCDSADRLRDTLIHELCHAATWLLHGVRDGHGRFWSLYAKKAVTVHPELPVVERCHNYEINYKFTYECSRCGNTIGRHSKSLDTQRFVCALCRGPLALCQPTRKDGTPAARALTPFAKFVKENYGSAKRSQQGLSHADVMKKLSADFASSRERALSF